MAILITLPSADPGLAAPDIVWDGVRGDFQIVSMPGQGPRGGLRAGETIATAILIQLFTDAACAPEDLRFEHAGDRRGWAGDGFGDEEPLGSLLWLYRRSALTDDTARKVRDAAAAALQTFVRQKICARVDVDATAFKDQSRIALRCRLFARDGSLLHAQQFDDLWAFASGISSPLAP